MNEEKASATTETQAHLEASAEETPLFANIEALQPAGPPEPGSLSWYFLGPNGLRAGWSIAVFISLLLVFMSVIGLAFFKLHLVGKSAPGGSLGMLCGELIPFLSLVGAAALVALFERRKRNLLAYNLLGPQRLMNFAVGLGAGFLALSALIGALKAGGWITLVHSSYSPAQVVRFALTWGIAFVLVGLFEEGTFRCYLQATLERGINFWWALGLEAAMCAFLLARGKGNGAWGVYAMALVGVLPCLWLHWKKISSRGFWQAAWAASTLFGFIHTGNNGESWIGIFAAAAIGFVFCVSVRVTGSAWWAIGFHAAWDWAETFFYGTADSGLPAKDSFLLAQPAGNTFWSGGASGPEGSALVLVVILLTLALLLAAYGRRKSTVETSI